MARLYRILSPIAMATIGFSLLALTSCSQPQSTAEQSASGSNSTATQTESTQADADQAGSTKANSTQTASTAAIDVSGLLTVVSQTQAAVEADDFEQARGEFAKFAATWQTVEPEVQAKSTVAHERIEKKMNRISESLKNGNKERSLTALQSMTNVLNKLK